MTIPLIVSRTGCSSPGIYAMGNNVGKIQKWCDIVGGSIRFDNVRLPIAGSVQHAKDNGKTVEIASELYIHWQFEGMRLRIPETEISDN